MSARQKTLRCFKILYGTEWPTSPLTTLTSEALMVPLTFISVRKLVESTVAPSWPLVWATSEALTGRWHWCRLPK